MSDITQEARPEPGMVSGVHHLKLRDGIANQAQGVDEAQAVWVKVMSQSRSVHNRADDEMGDEQGIQLLNQEGVHSPQLAAKRCSMAA